MHIKIHRTKTYLCYYFCFNLFNFSINDFHDIYLSKLYIKYEAEEKIHDFPTILYFQVLKGDESKLIFTYKVDTHQ